MVKAYPVVGKQKAVDICNAFIAGAPRNAKGSVFYGVNETNRLDWHTVKQSPQDWFYVDNSMFDAVRGQQYRISKNRIQCDPAGQVSNGFRFGKLGIDLKPWRPNIEGHYLVIEQSPSFMVTVALDPKWFERTVKGLRDEGIRVRTRPWARDKLEQQATLPADLAGASTLVTHSSAAAVTAVIEGIPAIVSKMSALAHMRWSTDAAHDERLSYLNVLADNEWTLDRIRSGEAWEWLMKS